MNEYVERALVIALRQTKNDDRMATLFTKGFGVVEARMVGGRRILSKFAPHLDVGNLAAVRLVKKRAWTVTDALTEEHFVKLRRNPKEFSRALALLALLARLMPREEPDARLWHAAVRALSLARVDMKTFLALLGYDVAHASCDVCGARRPPYFIPSSQSFICARCRGRFGSDAVEY